MPNKLYPSLLVVADSEKVDWYKVEKDSIEKIDWLVDRPDRYSDREGSFRTRGRGLVIRSGEPDVIKNREHEHIRHHTRRIMDHTVELLKTAPFYRVVFVQPAKFADTVRESVRARLHDFDVRTLVGDYMRSSMEQLRVVFMRAIAPFAA